MRQEFTRGQKMLIWEKSGRVCAECGEPLKFRDAEFDHVREQWGNGVNNAKNGQALCEPCHQIKTNKGTSDRAKADRIKKKNEGRWQSASRPINGSKRSGWYVPMNGKPQRR